MGDTILEGAERMKSITVALLFFAVCSCKARHNVDSDMKDSDTKYGRQAQAVFVAVNPESKKQLDEMFAKWTCQYSRSSTHVEVDAAGTSSSVAAEDKVNWLEDAGVSNIFALKTGSSLQSADLNLAADCRRSLSIPCGTTNVYNNGHVVGSEASKNMCTKEVEVHWAWNCAVGSSQPTGGNKNIACKVTKGPMANPVIATDHVPSGPKTIVLNVKQQAAKVFDIDNCNGSNVEPFYVHITSSLQGKAGEAHFGLKVFLDGQEVKSAPADAFTAQNDSGMFTLAIAHCRTQASGAINVRIEGRELDTAWDDVYSDGQGKSGIAMKRGEKRVLRMVREGIFSNYESDLGVEVLKPIVDPSFRTAC